MNSKKGKKLVTEATRLTPTQDTRYMDKGK